METKNNIKTKEDVVKATKMYLTKTSKHLFVTGDGYYYKIETFERDGKLYDATIFMGNGKVMINVKEGASDRQFAAYGNNTLSVLQQELFPKYLKVKSIPYFKKMRALISEMVGEIKLDNTANKELGDKFKERLLELEITK